MKQTLIVLGVLLLIPQAALNAADAPQAMLDLALEPPVVNTKPGPEYGDQVRVGNMVIGIERTPKGRLWACWVGNGDSPNGFFMLATSDDSGATWSKPRVVIDPTDPPNAPQRRALVGNLWTDPLGRLWCFFDQSLGYFDGRCGDWFIRCDDPDAAEPTWTKPVRFADGCTLNKPTVLTRGIGFQPVDKKNDRLEAYPTGDWLLPVSHWTRDRISIGTSVGIPPDIFNDAHKDLDSLRMANVFASTDQGKTWTRRGGVAFPDTAFDEHMIVELKDGRLWMLARTKDGIAQAESFDRGATWVNERPFTTERGVNMRFFLRKLKSGALLLVVNDTPRGRSHLTAMLSEDDGKTWPHKLLLDERSRVSYPDGTEGSNGFLYITYDRGRYEKDEQEILFAKITEADIKAGQIVSDGSQLRQLINRLADFGGGVRMTREPQTMEAEFEKSRIVPLQ